MEQSVIEHKWTYKTPLLKVKTHEMQEKKTINMAINVVFSPCFVLYARKGFILVI